MQCFCSFLLLIFFGFCFLFWNFVCILFDIVMCCVVCRMDSFNLKMHFRGRFVEIRVDYIDRCLLIDVINDMYDEVEKHRMPLPKHPSLSYFYKMKSYDLNDDKDLLEMFKRCADRNDIDIWIGCDTSPRNVLVMARKLRASKSSEIVNDVNSDVLPGFNSFENVEVQPLNPLMTTCSNSDFVVGSGRHKLQVRRTPKPTHVSPLSPLYSSRCNNWKARYWVQALTT
ncbi:hypothetical protein RND81_05G141200 [Saponaria officinalis]|uniref:PB1 domain-containing protein n=1 Tax=Saponaria officinalis TaxID=3572 RepID=A0AAW1L0V8_SAPOF